MIWKEVERIYGKEMADKMSHSKYLQGITVEFTEEGEADIPFSDIDNAYRDIKNIPLPLGCWD